MGGGVSGRGSGSGSRSSRVNWDKQNKHDKKSKHYVKGKSYTTIPRDSIQNFISHFDNCMPAVKRGVDEMGWVVYYF